MNQRVEVLVNGTWHEASWERRAKRCKKTWHVVRLIAPLPQGGEIEIPACGLFVRRCQLRGLKGASK